MRKIHLLFVFNLIYAETLLPAYDLDRKPCAFSNVNNKNIGFIVDRIMNVAYVNEDNLESISPIFQTSLEVSYIKNIIKFEDRPRILIDLAKVLSEAEQIIIQKEILT